MKKKKKKVAPTLEQIWLMAKGPVKPKSRPTKTLFSEYV